MGKLSISPLIPTIPFGFWDDLYKAPKEQWPAVVVKYSLTPEQLYYVASRREIVFENMRKSEESAKEWNDNASRYYFEKFGKKYV